MEAHCKSSYRQAIPRWNWQTETGPRCYVRRLLSNNTSVSRPAELVRCDPHVPAGVSFIPAGRCLPNRARPIPVYLQCLRCPSTTTEADGSQAGRETEREQPECRQPGAFRLSIVLLFYQQHSATPAETRNGARAKQHVKLHYDIIRLCIAAATIPCIHCCRCFRRTWQLARLRRKVFSRYTEQQELALVAAP